MNMLVRAWDIYAFVYNTTERTTFSSILLWSDYIRSISKKPNSFRGAGTHKPAVLIALIATNCDVEDSAKQISSSEGKHLASELNCSFYETSARTGEGCHELFNELAIKCRELIDVGNILSK